MAKKILISVGGTGGHLFPAQSLAEQLQEEGTEFLFVGAGLSTSPYFDQAKFNYLEIAASPLSLRIGLKCLKNGFSILKGVYQSLRILKKYKPDLIIGFGSFHTFPLLIGSHLLRKPYYLHEQNVQLGRVNRIFAKYSKALATHYPKTIPHFPKKNVRVQMPLKFWKTSLPEAKSVRLSLGLDPERKTMLIFGGSQGAHSLNRVFLESISMIDQTQLQVIHLVGKNYNQQQAQSVYKKAGISAYVKDYEENMLNLLISADFILSRSGASTIAEQIELKIPSIMIPYPHASNHQEQNANYMEQVVQGGIKLLEKELNASLLTRIIHSFLNDCNRKQYIQNIQNYKDTRVTLSFADFIKQEIKKYGRK